MAKKQAERAPRQVAIVWDTPTTITTRFVTHSAIQDTGQELVLTFFEVHPPLLTGTPEEQQAQFADIQSVQAEPVARVTLTYARAQELIDLLQRHSPTTAETPDPAE